MLENEFDRIRRVVQEADVDGPLTAHEINELLAEHGEPAANPHRIATVLGNRAERGQVEVLREQPFRYRIKPVEAE